MAEILLKNGLSFSTRGAVTEPNLGPSVATYRSVFNREDLAANITTAGADYIVLAKLPLTATHLASSVKYATAITVTGTAGFTVRLAGAGGNVDGAVSSTTVTAGTTVAQNTAGSRVDFTELRLVATGTTMVYSAGDIEVTAVVALLS